jgi:ferredoxin
VQERKGWGWGRPSTRAFAQEGRKKAGYSLFDWLHGYVYARWPYLYIGIGTGEHALSGLASLLTRLLSQVVPGLRGGPLEPRRVTFADTYHGKVMPLDQAKRLVNVQQEIRIDDLEQVIPYAQAREIVLQNPDHIVALDCPCRTVRPNPCQPVDVCLIVGEPFASFVSEHHPHRSRWVSQAEAAEILHAEHERGHVHHAFFKDAMLGRFYAICNCCSCCCGAMQAHRNGTPMLASSGYVSQVQVEQCVGCGICVEYCQFGALSLNGGHVIVDTAACMGCGACVTKCTRQALSLVRDPAKGEPLEIQAFTDHTAQVT